MRPLTGVLRAGSAVLIVTLAGLLAPAVLAQDMTRKTASALDSVGELESALLGAAKSGPAVERTAGLETALFGKSESGPILPRLGRLKEYLLSGDPKAVAVRLSGLELALFERVNALPLANRLAEVEKALSGAAQEGDLLERLEADLKTVGLDGTRVKAAAIPAGTRVKVKLSSTITSDETQKADMVRYEVVQSVILDGVTVIAAGAGGTAHVASVKPAGVLGKDAHLELDFCTVTGVDGSLIPLTAETTEFTPANGDRSRAVAMGAGVAGVALLGPVGVAGSILIKGRDLTFPAGTEFELVTREPVSVTTLGK